MPTSNTSDSEMVEPTLRSADIIPFPTRPAAEAVIPTEEVTPEVRLARALASLQQALAEQRVAIAKWREVLGQLKTTTSGLHDSLQRYRTNLNKLGTSVADLHDKAQTLAEWADGAGATRH